jgi:type I restriction enzyme R subunit
MKEEGKIREDTAEYAALSWFKDLGYSILYGPDLAPGELYSERADYADVALKGRLEKAIAKRKPRVRSLPCSLR